MNHSSFITVGGIIGQGIAGEDVTGFNVLVDDLDNILVDELDNELIDNIP